MAKWNLDLRAQQIWFSIELQFFWLGYLYDFMAVNTEALVWRKRAERLGFKFNAIIWDYCLWITKIKKYVLYKMV